MGFTLIELLVVVVILGVLIAIAIPLYLNYKKGAYLTAAKSDVHTLQLAEEAYAATHSSYGTTVDIGTPDVAPKLSKGSMGVVVWAGTSGYCVAVVNTNGPDDPGGPGAQFGFPFKTYFFDSTTGIMSDVRCTPPPGETVTGLTGSYIDDTGLK